MIKVGTHVRIDTGDRDGIVNGIVRSVIQSNRNNSAVDSRLVHTTYVVALRLTCLRRKVQTDTVVRFHERRSGHIFTSNNWALEIA